MYIYLFAVNLESEMILSVFVIIIHLRYEHCLSSIVVLGVECSSSKLMCFCFYSLDKSAELWRVSGITTILPEVMLTIQCHFGRRIARQFLEGAIIFFFFVRFSSNDY